MSSCIVWEKKYSVGIKQIDEEHKMLVQLINEACDSAELMEADEATDLLLQHMQEYAEKHFATEEGLMREHGFVPTDKHLEKHRLFGDRVRNAIARGKHGVDPYKVFQFLRDWFHGHVMVDDKALGAFLRNKGLR